jgi:hypothetical protein
LDPALVILWNSDGLSFVDHLYGLSLIFRTGRTARVILFLRRGFPVHIELCIISRRAKVLIVVQLSIGILIMARLEYFPDLFRATTGGTTDGTIYVLLCTLQFIEP